MVSYIEAITNNKKLLNEQSFIISKALIGEEESFEETKEWLWKLDIYKELSDDELSKITNIFLKSIEKILK